MVKTEGVKMTIQTQDLYNGIKQAFQREQFPWDDYFLRMAEADFLSGRAEHPTVKSYFVRKAPFGGSYTLLGGITAALVALSELRFDTDEFVEGMIRKGYSSQFTEFLRTRGGLRNVTVHAAPEGTPFFPNEPIVTLVGPRAELRLADGLLISELNFASLSLTKWNRIVRAVRPGSVLEFARRRSQNHMKSSLYGMLAGCGATSNDELERFFQVSVRGTMGHEWPQSFRTLREAFDTWLVAQPQHPIGLIDTVRCLEEDFPEWLDAVYRHRVRVKEANPAIWGWRNDSGDLAYLTIEQYVRFQKHPLAQDEWFRDRMRIFLTNELDEFSSGSIVGQITKEARAAGFDSEDILRRIIWGAGTKPGVCEDSPALGGVMKLMESEGRACMKLALDEKGLVGPKTSIPGFNLSGMLYQNGQPKDVLLYPARKYTIGEDGKFYEIMGHRLVNTIRALHPDNAMLFSEFAEYHIEPRQQIVFQKGSVTLDWERNRPTIRSVVEYVMKSVDALPWWVTRIEKPHSFPLSVTPDLFNLREHMIRGHDLQAEYSLF